MLIWAAKDIPGLAGFLLFCAAVYFVITFIIERIEQWKKDRRDFMKREGR
jgi:hypothetical protein